MLEYPIIVNSFNEQTHENINPRNINKIDNRVFSLSPSVEKGLDIECQASDFVKESQLNAKVTIGFIGQAYFETHKKTNKMYCIKAIKKDYIKDTKKDKMKRILKSMYKIKHPSFVRLLNHFETQTQICLIFQCVNQSTLLEKITHNVPLSYSQFLKYMRQILEAVNYLHSLNSYDNSLEAETIIIDNKDNVRLTDYGWSQLLGSNMNQRNGEALKISYAKKEVCVSINSYVAPEMLTMGNNGIVLNRNNASKESDIWQLGILFYEMATGQVPFSTNIQNNLKHFDIKKVNMNLINKQFDFLKELIPKMLKVLPKERIRIKDILEIPEMANISYDLPPFDPEEEIITRLNSNLSPQEQLILNVKKEKEKLKAANAKLEKEINELKTQNDNIKKHSKELEEFLNSPNQELLNQNVEYQSQISILKNELETTKINLTKEKKKNDELKKKLNELQFKLEKKEKTFDEDKEKKYEKVIDFISGSKNSGDLLAYYLPMLTDSVKEFIGMINKVVEQSNISNENYIQNFKDMLDQRDVSYQALRDTLKENMLSIKINEINSKATDELSELLLNKTKELSAVKNKINSLESEKSLLEKENKSIKEIEHLYKEQNEDLVNLQKMQSDKITEMKNQIQRVYDFIFDNFPGKLEKFKQISKLYNIF